MSSVDRKRVAIIGAGSSGLIALKCCLDEGFDCIVFEKSEVIGGLWNYREDNVADEEVGSIMKSLVMNTSKELTSYSLMPPPSDFPLYMHNTKMMQYLTAFAEKFQLNKHILFNQNVLSLEQNSVNNWILSVKDQKSGQTVDHVFDCVCVCSGLNNRAKRVHFDDQHLFEGRVIHARDYKTSAREGCEGKRVCVVGVGNSALDIAVEVSHVADQVYLSTRSGTWVVRRVGVRGLPFDAQFHRKSTKMLMNLFPESLRNFFAEKALQWQTFDHKLYGLKPEHRVLNQHPAINDELISRLASGSVLVRDDITRFWQRGVVFQDSPEEVEVDIVIMATGYQLDYPFLPKHIKQISKDHFPLFKHVFHPDVTNAHTLAFIACVQPNGAVPPLAELQARWFCSLNKVTPTTSLPSKEKMKKSVERREKAIRKRYAFNVERHVLQEDWQKYLDELARDAGCKPQLWKYFFTDIKLWSKLFFGPLVPYQYRLTGANSDYEKSRDLIMTSSKRTKAPLSGRKVK